MNKELYDFLFPFIGLPVWGSSKGHGSFVTFNLGKPSVELTKFEKRTKGELYIWLYCCNWRIINIDEELAHCESKDKRIDKAVEFIDGQKLMSINIDSEKLRMIFDFDLGGRIYVWNNESYGEDTDLVMMRNQKEWLSFNNDHSFYIGNEKEKQLILKGPLAIMSTKKS